MKIYRAQALAALGKTKEAKETLGEALAVSLPDRMYLPFAENYEGIKKLLPDCCEQEERETIAALARMLAVGLETITAQGLTPRELEIVRLIKQGYSYPAIAKELHIAVSTVKSHVKSIFIKTDTTSQMQIALLDL